LEEAWPKLASAGIQMGEGRPIEEVEEALGPGITKQLKVITAGIINNFDENEASLIQRTRPLAMSSTSSDSSSFRLSAIGSGFLPLIATGC